jgi:hypothetical protein
MALLAVTGGCTGLHASGVTPSPEASAPSRPRPRVLNSLTDNPNPPTETVKLVFIHHSCGENWLDDGNGGLGIALRDSNYFVSDTNYDWGPACPDCGNCPGSGSDHIGNCTDILHWDNWFVSSNSSTYLSALYTEYGQYSSYSRLPIDPGGQNEIVMFKSCYPNSNLGGNPDDPPESPGESLTVGSAKYIYNTIRDYFETRTDVLFVVITAPPVTPGDSWDPPANARGFNNWLVEDWLEAYPYDNVAVFDFYSVLTSNGGHPDANDVGRETGNHHRWWNVSGSWQTQHLQTLNNDLAAYPVGDSHPTAAGNQKATAEFVQLLNVYYNRWKSGGPAIPALTLTAPNGSERWAVGSTQQIHWTATGSISSVSLAYSTDDFATSHVIEPSTSNTSSYDWTVPDDPSTSVRVRVTSVVSPTTVWDESDGHFTIYDSSTFTESVFMPVVLRNHAPPPPSEGTLVQPGDLVYQGAFRLPVGAERPKTFAYGGAAMTFHPSGDPSGPDDGFPGSLFIMGHDRLPYGELPEGNQVAEIDIPVPDVSDNLGDLNQADFIQGFSNVAEGHFTELEEIPRTGMQYLSTPATGAKIHLAWGQHLQPDPPVASHAWFDPDLAAPDLQGIWFIGDQSLYSVNGYMFEIPAAWAEDHTGGMMLATGRYRDGGWSGMGPSLFAYAPWLDGNPPAAGTHLSERTLLLYSNTRGEDQTDFRMNGYQHSDEWEGGAWLTTADGRTAVVFAGTKGAGYCWYGWASPGGDGMPCVEGGASGYITCYTPDWTECPPELSRHCEEGSSYSYRGWWSSRFDAQMLFYDPVDLARVASASASPHEPQPYSTLDIDEHLFLGPSPEPMATGSGDQRRFRIGEMAYDRQRGFLYVPELLADDARPVIHVWSVQ